MQQFAPLTTNSRLLFCDTLPTCCGLCRPFSGNRFQTFVVVAQFEVDLPCGFYVLLTVHLSIILDDDQRDAHLLYFTIYLLHSSTFFNVLLTVHFCDD